MSALELRRLSVRSSVSLATGALSAACLAFNGRVATEPDEPLDASGDLGDESPAYTPDPGVRCGAATWCPPDTVCCTKRGESGWFTQAPPCGGPGTCGFFASFACDDPWDCGDGGQAHAYSCCASRSDNANAFEGSSCIAAGATCGVGSLAALLCDPVDPEPCPDAGPCVEADGSVLPPGFFVCE